MVSRGSTDRYYGVAKYEIRGRKISNRMDEILAVLIQDNAYREQAKTKTYHTPTTNPVNQLITSPTEADKIAEAAQRQADNIMAIAFPSGPEPLLAEIDTGTTQTAQSVPPTASLASTVTTATDCLDRGRQPRLISPAFIMNTIPDNWPGPTTNSLLVVNTGQDRNTNSFITPTLVTSHQNCQGNGNTFTFENTIPETDKQINARLVEIANQGPTQETTAISCLDCTLFQTDASIQTMENTSTRACTLIKTGPTITTTTKTTDKHWENQMDRTCNNCGNKGHIARYCTKTSLWCQWCHTATHDTQACRSKP